MNEILEVPTTRDLSWMIKLTNPRSLDWRYSEPVTFEIPWLTFDQRKEKVPAVAVWYGPMAVLAIGVLPKYVYSGPFSDKEYLKIQRECLLAEAQQMWPLPEEPVTVLRGVDFTHFKRWVDEGAGLEGVARLGVVLGAIVDRAELKPVLELVHLEDLVLAWPQDPKVEQALHICGRTWKVFYQPIPKDVIEVGVETLATWRNA